MKMKKFVSILTSAFAGLAMQYVASAGDIYEIRPCYESGEAIPSPDENKDLRWKEVAYFNVRLINREEAEAFDLKYKGIWSPEMSALLRPPEIGIYVGGRLERAKLVCELSGSRKRKDNTNFTDLIFAYEVQAGDLALPIRLANQNGMPILDANESVGYQFMPGIDWEVSNNKNELADFQYCASREGPEFVKGPDGAPIRDYDLTKCNLRAKAVDFDVADPAGSDDWRVVYQGGNVSNTVPAQIIVNGIADDYNSIYLWSEDESVFYVERDKAGNASEWKDIVVGYEYDDYGNATAITEKRHVLKIDTIPGKGDRDNPNVPYEFELRGATNAMIGQSARLIMSGTNDFWYTVYMAQKRRVNDYLSNVVVRVCDPRPPTITATLGKSTVTVTDDPTSPLTSLEIKVYPKWEGNREFEAKIEPSFTATGSDHPWYDYIRFATSRDTDISLQKEEDYTNATIRISANGVVTHLNGKELKDPGIIYVYGLYSDKYSNGSKVGTKTGRFELAVTTTDTGAKEGIKGWDDTYALTVKAESPKLSTRKRSIEALSGVAQSFELSLTDIWGNLNYGAGTAGYELYYQDVETEGAEPSEDGWKRIGAASDYWMPDEESATEDTPAYLKDAATAKALPTVTYPITGTYYTYFCVKGINGKFSGKSAADALLVKVTVKDADTITAEISEDGNTWRTTGEYKEGTSLKLRVKLSTRVKEDVYAFLAPIGDSVDYVSGKVVTNSEFTSGLPISHGETDSEVGSFNLLDGTKDGKVLKFDIVLCRTEDWNPNQIVTTYKSKQFNVNVLNVTPTVKEVQMDNSITKVTADGQTMHTGSGATEKVAVVPLGMTKSFKIIVNEPGDTDKKTTIDGSKFTLQYTVAEPDGTVYAPPPLEGNPDVATNFTYKFEHAGLTQITLQMRDKDMEGDFGNYTFTFGVEVSEQPTILIEAVDVDESKTGKNAPLKLALSNDYKQSLTTKVSVAYMEQIEKDRTKLGYIRLGGCLNTTPYIDEDGSEYYYVVLNAEGKATLTIDESDGTKISDNQGYTITAEIVDSRINSASRTPWSEFFRKNTAALSVANAKPILAECSLGKTEESGSMYTNKVGIGENIAIKYRVSDVMADVTNSPYLKVVWSDTDNRTFCTTNINNITNEYEVSTKFKKPGPKQITVKIYDKDSDTSDETTYYLGTWNFEVESTKVLVTIANGPGSGVASSTLSQKYAGARGVGQGHTFSDATFSSADEHRINWNCSPTEMSASVWGWGYKTNTWDDGTLDSESRYQHDIPLSPNGNNVTENGRSVLGDDTPADYYKYADALRDSFLYGWICHSAGEGNSTGGGSGGGAGAGGGTTGLTATFMGISPEYTERGMAPAIATLPNGENNDASKAGANAVVTYPTTYMEAIFSKELLPSDNMGDINQDGVPDAYLLVSGYNFGIFEGGELTGDDLRDLNLVNEEEGGTEDGTADCPWGYLPTKETAAYASFIPGLAETWVKTGRQFLPRMKIRGFDEDDAESIANRGTSVSALNDAPNQVGVSGVKPDRHYTNPRTDKDSTLNYVEWLAWSEYKAANPEASENDWSPERPSNPTKIDTDGDGLADGLEYYYWYNAHVGYIENGVHKYLTGRKYNPRNPGDGDVITPEEIKAAFDPQNPTGSKLSDTDNDGLPDALEFEIGTNPLDFDTDGDGLPDGWEIMIAGLDPLMVTSSVNAPADRLRNFDGDAMAISSYKLEKSQKPVPTAIEHAKLTTFAVLDVNGDTDGVQWIGMREAPEVSVVTNEETKAFSFKMVDGDITYLTYSKPILTEEGYLAQAIVKGGVDADGNAVGAFIAEEPVETPVLDEGGNPVMVQDVDEDGALKFDEGGEPVMVEKKSVSCVRGYPVRIEAGAKIDVASLKEDVISIFSVVSADIEEKNANALWIYGKGSAADTTIGQVADTASEYGCLALGRQKDVKKGMYVCVMPSDSRDVAFLHYLVYQEFGFDPRTAWCPNDPVAKRWSKMIDGEIVEGVTTMRQGGYAGVPSRTREYRTYDEFLVYSFFLLNGCDMDGETYVLDADAPDWAKTWSAFTTNPQGPNEPDLINEDHYYGRAAAAGQDATNGADSDMDGVPDGWELYVMSGPKRDDAYVFANPYKGFKVSCGADMPESYFSPFVNAAKKTATNNQIYLGGSANCDELNEFQEFEGTDSINYYSVAQNRQDKGADANAYSSTIVHDGEWKWFNKFFPTDPWNVDTDGDGLSDKAEGQNFVYGEPADNGTLWSIPGGGLNPCTVDTDLDGLPDPWEAQFKGKTIYSGEFADYAADGEGNQGNPRQGLVDGMDGTVKDAFSYPVTYDGNVGGQSNLTTYIEADGFRQVVNRDYDHDGLENWQEYLTGTMRCWRYDDPYSSWTYMPEALYFKYNEKTQKREWKPDYAGINALFGEDTIDTTAADGGKAEFFYKTLVDVTSPIYNPHFVTEMSSGAQYFSRVVNPWDCAYVDSAISSTRNAAYYWFYNRIGETSLNELWGPKYGYIAAPTKYACCSPVNADTDRDGMDDYYELFHGMNPLLGKSGAKDADGPCDIVFDSWPASLLFEAWGEEDDKKNFWQLNPIRTPRGNGFDFELFPWLNGLADADPDGDILPNQEESLMPKLSNVAIHTDPTPLWMTDSSYSNSLVRMFFRLPTRYDDVVPSFNGNEFEYDGVTYKLSDFDGWIERNPTSGVSAHFGAFVPDAWSLAGEESQNWIVSFEENEGYDSDHDGISDYEEKEGKFRMASDPQNFDSPRRRQAMYFQGGEKPSALQTMPFVSEKYPTKADYPDDMAFIQFTAECWVKPESLESSIILERAVWTGYSNPGDAEYMRKNFQLGIKTDANGSVWYAKFDPVGTADDTREVIATSKTPALTTAWTHLAVTYDGQNLVLYVNGKAERTTWSGLPPSWGATVVKLTADQGYLSDAEHSLRAIIIGAGAKTQAQGAENGLALDVTRGLGWNAYTGFYKGWIDEIRIWDGARSARQILEEMKVRYTDELAAINRSNFYDEWKEGKRRYEKDGSGKDVDMMAELRYHWSFDSIFGAENEVAVADAPHGFDGTRPLLSRPEGYEISWWKKVLFGDGNAEGYSNTVYGNPAWICWIPNTVAHLPRFDGTTLDSVYWSEDFQGGKSGTYRFARTAEPVSFWTQMMLNNVQGKTAYQTTGSHHFLVNADSRDNGSMFSMLYKFTGRNLNQTGDDLLPLGGAYVRYCDSDTNLWDGQGPSTNWEVSGDDADGDGLPGWWEDYADTYYRGGLDPAEEMGWNTIIDYHGHAIAAGEAYLRDLAKGAYENADRRLEFGDSKFAQIADEDANGMPDWWADMYGISNESGLDDHDNDGLPNYVEYLLSEAFEIQGIVFDPTVACSVDKYTPDYFFKVGDIYVGEIFTDHDFVDDAWEDTYGKDFTSRLDYDAFADNDRDGWSNRSENRYSKQVMPTIADQQAHYTAADGLVADYPIPTLELTIHYNGKRQTAIGDSPIVIQVTTDTKFVNDPDATYRIGAASDVSAGTGTGSNEGTSSGASTEVAYTRTIGKWSDRHAIGTLTPGNIKINSIELQGCYDPSSVMYTWSVAAGGSLNGLVNRGTRAEFDEAKRKYGDANVQLIGTDTGYSAVDDLELKSGEDSSMALWVHTKTGKQVGTVNLVTGEFDLDLGFFKGWVLANPTNATEFSSMEDQTYRIAYASNPSVGLPRKLYLGEADTGHVKEGRNSIAAWADLNGDGLWDAGEPYGIVRDVNVSWKGTKAAIELTDVSPVTPRFNLVAAGGSAGGESGGGSGAEGGNSTDSSDRAETRQEITDKLLSDAYYNYGNNPAALETALSRLEWIDGNIIEDAPITETFKGQRIRVVRWLINGIPTYRAGTSARTVLDKKIETDVRNVFTEADVLVDNDAFDLDWHNFSDEVANNVGVRSACGRVTNVTYLVVVGDGPDTWRTYYESNYTVKALSTVITRKYGATQVKPTAIAPGAVNNEIVHSANPTFKWKVDCPDEEGYTAFRIVVMDENGSEVIYNSGIVAAPPRIGDAYVWEAPLYVGDKTLEGKVFENKKRYIWKVTMYNSKFREDVYSDPGKFLMEVQENGYYFGTANVAVRYFGPASTYSKNGSDIRVRAFASPDFTGKPVAAGYVAHPGDAETGVAAIGKSVKANCQIVGIPSGKYYLHAYIDSNNNGICEPWETSGYLCTRDGSVKDYLNPVAMTFGSEKGDGDLAIIYLEDADTDGDGMPDAWEYAEFGSLTAKGVELLVETKAGEFVVNPALSGALELQKNAQVPTAGLAGRLSGTGLMSNAGVLALAMGAPTDGYDSFTAAIKGYVSPELVEDGVRITSLDITDGKVTIKVEAETETAGSALIKGGQTLRVMCQVQWKQFLTDTVWQPLGDPVEITVGAEAAEIPVEKFDENAGSGYFSVRVYGK